MRRRTLAVAILACASVNPLAASAADPPVRANPDRLITPQELGYDISGEVHEDASLPVRAIVYSDRRLLGPVDGQPEAELTYRVCNINTGDPASQRAAAKLYFQWPDAGFGTSLQRELPVETCALLVRNVSAATKQSMSNLLYTYSATPVPARAVWMMDWTPPLSPHYLRYGIALYEDQKWIKGIKNPQQLFRIQTVRKSAGDKIGLQELGWQAGTELYLALPTLAPEELSQYRTALGRLEGRGVRFSIRPGEQAAQDFGQGAKWAALQFGNRNVLKLDRQPSQEKDNEFQSFQLDVPMSNVGLVELPALLRERSSGQALYQARYVTVGR